MPDENGTADTGGAWVAIGDSLARGFQRFGGLGGSGVDLDPQNTDVYAAGGRSPATVLKFLQSQPDGSLAGNHVVLSSGVSNDPSQIDLVQQQLAELRRLKAGQVRLMGVGSQAGAEGGQQYNLAPYNDQLAAAAKAAGVDFMGPVPAVVHPARSYYAANRPRGADAGLGAPLPGASDATNAAWAAHVGTPPSGNPLVAPAGADSLIPGVPHYTNQLLPVRPASALDPLFPTSPPPALGAQDNVLRAQPIPTDVPPAAGQKFTFDDPRLWLIAKYEARFRPNIGWEETDLSGVPLTETGFPNWPGKPGPQGNSTAAGLFQIERSTWDPIARQLGIHDFSVPSQIAVAKELIRRDPSLGDWLPYNKALAAAYRAGETGTEAILGTGGIQLAAAGQRPTGAGAGGPPGTDMADALRNQLRDFVAPGGAAAAAMGTSPVTQSQTRMSNLSTMLALAAAGTHKFVPVKYDPWAGGAPAPVEPLRAPSLVAGALPEIGAGGYRVPQLPASSYLTRVGMRSQYAAG